MGSAVDMAAAIVTARPGLDQMQLHKLLYLVQAAHLAWFDDPAFDERIEAWTYGPMIKGVAGLYQDYGRRAITRPEKGDPERISKRTAYIIDRLVAAYSDHTGPELSAVTKAAGSPWQQTRGPLPPDAPSSDKIPLALIKSYHHRRGVLPVAQTEEEHELTERFLHGDDDALTELLELTIDARSSR